MCIQESKKKKASENVDAVKCTSLNVMSPAVLSARTSLSHYILNKLEFQQV